MYIFYTLGLYIRLRREIYHVRAHWRVWYPVKNDKPFRSQTTLLTRGRGCIVVIYGFTQTLIKPITCKSVFTKSIFFIFIGSIATAQTRPPNVLLSCKWRDDIFQICFPFVFFFQSVLKRRWPSLWLEKLLSRHFLSWPWRFLKTNIRPFRLVVTTVTITTWYICALSVSLYLPDVH